MTPQEFDAVITSGTIALDRTVVFHCTNGYAMPGKVDHYLRGVDGTYGAYLTSLEDDNNVILVPASSIVAVEQVKAE